MSRLTLIWLALGTALAGLAINVLELSVDCRDKGGIMVVVFPFGVDCAARQP